MFALMHTYTHLTDECIVFSVIGVIQVTDRKLAYSNIGQMTDVDFGWKMFAGDQIDV